MSIVIRDQVWDDIVLDELEAAIIDTKEMQRLRWIRQLGTAYVSYPSANHVRFEHSLGTCHIAGRIFDAAEKNKDEGIPMTQEDRTLVRLLGLLHDVSHIAFGHVLEDQLCVFGKETHDTPDRLELFIDPIAENDRVQSALEHGYPSNLFHRIKNILGSKPKELDKPYLLEIVKDTVCADLLDYLRRDYRTLGIRRQYDDRIYQYFSVARCDDGKAHLIVELTDKGRRAEDSLTEIENLLRIRYTMAERVWFHHTKLGFDALIDKAVFYSDIRTDRQVMDWLGDEGLIVHLERLGTEYPIASKLGKRLRSRKHYVPAYTVSYANRGGPEQWKDCMAPQGRRDAEAEIATRAAAKGAAITLEDVVVLCPPWRMSMKEAAVLVRDEKGKIMPLSERGDSQAQGINERHERLWRFYAYCPAHLTAAVGEACQGVFGHANEYVP